MITEDSTLSRTATGDESQPADYVSTYYGKTVEEMEAYWNEGMEKSIRLEFSYRCDRRSSSALK